MAYDGIDNVKSFEPTPVKKVKITNKAKSKTISNVELFCWECKNSMTASQIEGGIPIPCDHCGEYMITPKSRFAPNVVVGDFVIKRKLGSGGAGTVFLAYQKSLDRLCALKVLHDNVTGDESLLKEARIAAKLNHQYIIQCYSVDITPTLCYYAMEYVSGRSLKDILEKNWKIPQVKSLNIAIQVCEALNHGWKESRLTHHDIKPDNIMISEDGDVKVADLGLAKLATDRAIKSSDNIFRGTPEYACPEVIKNEETDFRADMYSIGAVLYHVLTGTPPFTSSDCVELLKFHINDQPADPRTHVPEICDGLALLVLKLLEKDPNNRYPNYDALLSDLRELRHDICTSSMQDTNLLLDDFREIDKAKATVQIKRKPKKKMSKSVKRVYLTCLAACSITALIFAPKIKMYLKLKEREHRLGEFMHLIISSAIPDPIGYDAGNEIITIFNGGKTPLNLNGSYLVDNSKNKMGLSGTIKPGQTLEVVLDPKLVQLDNMGDELAIYTPENALIHEVSYSRDNITQGGIITFKAK